MTLEGTEKSAEGRIPENWRRLEGFRSQIESIAPMVGAVLKTDSGATEIVGTAFLIDDRRAISSLRVAKEINEPGSNRILSSLSEACHSVTFDVNRTV